MTLDTPAYLPESRAYYRKFVIANKEDIMDTLKLSRTGRGTGYSDYYRSDEVTDYMHTLVHNIDETFGNVEIPADFPSPELLINAWKGYQNIIIRNNNLFKDILEKYKDKKDELSDPFRWSYTLHEKLRGLMSVIMNMDEVKNYRSDEKASTPEADPEPATHFPIIIVTALRDTEYVAVKKLPCNFVSYDEPDDNTTYHRGEIDGVPVLTATDDTMGLAASATLATKLIAKFSPKFLIMAGIAAGVKDEGKDHGDVLVANYSWNYESGKHKYNEKLKKSIFEPNPEQIAIDAKLKEWVKELKDDEDVMQIIKDGYTENPPHQLKAKSKLSVHVGPVASGSAVLGDKDKLAEIIRNNRKLQGIDMETFGIYYAAHSFTALQHTRVASIKSISDFADQRKNDKYRDYAAHTSAWFIYYLIKKFLITKL